MAWLGQAMIFVQACVDFVASLVLGKAYVLRVQAIHSIDTSSTLRKVFLTHIIVRFPPVPAVRSSAVNAMGDAEDAAGPALGGHEVVNSDAAAAPADFAARGERLSLNRFVIGKPMPNFCKSIR